MININEKFPFTYPINADDKIDITIKNVISQTWLKGEIKYYDKEGVVRKLDTNYLGWTCNEKPAIKIGNGYNNIMKISLNENIDPTGASYVCSVKIPNIQPLLQKIKIDDYLTSLKVNDIEIPIQIIENGEEIPVTWTLNAGDKVDISIKNNAGKMGLCQNYNIMIQKTI